MAHLEPLTLLVESGDTMVEESICIEGYDSVGGLRSVQKENFRGSHVQVGERLRVAIDAHVEAGEKEVPIHLGCGEGPIIEDHVGVAQVDHEAVVCERVKRLYHVCEYLEGEVVVRKPAVLKREDEQDDEGNARGIHHVLAHWEVLVYELCIDFALRVLFYILFCPPKVVRED